MEQIRERVTCLVYLMLLWVSIGFLQEINAQETEKVDFTRSAFPRQKYVPFGYLDNPWHSYIHRSGIIRTVPPMGMGYWTTSLPWPYATRMTRLVNYLSFLHLGFSIDGQTLATSEDFRKCGLELYSEYHTKNILSYNWKKDQMQVNAIYYLVGENNLVCRLELINTGKSGRQVTAHVTHEYGHIEQRWWGSSGITSHFDPNEKLLVDKLWEYGDVFVAGSDLSPEAVKSTADEIVWQSWIRQNDLTSKPGISIEFQEAPALYCMQSYPFNLSPGSVQTCTFILSRATNQLYAVQNYRYAQQVAQQVLDSLLTVDHSFYSQAPRLEGDWPETWKQGWIYDFETLRMTVRQPAGMYKNPWDGMQIYAPRSVLGEASLDMLCLSYADMDLAKKVVYGTFADAPMPNIPCSREDGSMNMIGSGGEECGTSPVWGLPFSVIYSLYHRSGDLEWLKSMYPYMKSFLEWWLRYRTDEEGWFFCNNSWESGQDGSLRFTFDGGGEGDVSDFVRTVDVEAAMADAMIVMSKIAPLTGHSEDTAQWNAMSADRIRRMQQMYQDGWFRDVDGRNGKPILIDTYSDVMMLLPVTTGLATANQIKEIAPRFTHFIEGKGCLVWPPGIFFFTEAMRNAQHPELGSQLIATTGSRIYGRTSHPETGPTGRSMPHLPEKYNYRIPGVSNEFWPVDLEKSGYGGAEQYGWGATLPAMVIRSLFGFVETDREDVFRLSPYIPVELSAKGSKFGISNLKYRELTVSYMGILKKNRIKNEIRIDAPFTFEYSVRNESGKTVATGLNGKPCFFDGKNGEKYTISKR